MPVPAAGLADVGVGDAHPLVLGGGLQHAAQQLAVLGLGLGLVAEGLAGAGDSCRERVAHLLQLTEARDPRLAMRSGDAGIDLDPREGLDHETRELALEAADLAAQLSPSEALIAPHPKRVGRVWFEQIQHGPFECRSQRRSRKRVTG